MPLLELVSPFTAGVERGDRYQTLLGITGSGKSFTIAGAIARAQRPTLILAPNKSLAAQLASEFREFFPKNRVEYFVSYYDYYQPEAYVPSTDTYIEKDSSINDEIDRLGHSATNGRRKMQLEFNAAHGIDPQTIRKKVVDILEMVRARRRRGRRARGSWSR